MRDSIESVEIYPKKLDNGRMLKQINFNFPVYYDGEVGKEIRLLNENTVETVVKLSLKKDTPKIEVTMEPGAESNYTPADKATYQKIKAYVQEKHGLNVSNLYIAQIKDKCGLDKRDNYNLPKSEDAKVPICPPEKEAAIMDAFRHFGMI